MKKLFVMNLVLALLLTMAHVLTVSASDTPLLAPGNHGTLAVKPDGTVWYFGSNIGYNRVTAGFFNASSGSDLPSGVRAVSSGHNNYSILMSDGTIWNLPSNTGSQGAVRGAKVSGAVAISGDIDFGAALKSDGTVWTWSTTRRAPTIAKDLSDVVAIAASINSQYVLCLKSDGTAWTYYPNAGYASTHYDLSDIRAISTGSNHALALKKDGTVWAWGNNSNGQLGDGTTTSREFPMQIPNLSGITAISAGSAYSVALNSNGTVWTWGRNNSGQLGSGGTADRPYPLSVANLSGVSAIAASKSGWGHTAVLKADGTVWKFGDTTYRTDIVERRDIYTAAYIHSLYPEKVGNYDLNWDTNELFNIDELNLGKGRIGGGITNTPFDPIAPPTPPIPEEEDNTKDFLPIDITAMGESSDTLPGPEITFGDHSFELFNLPLKTSELTLLDEIQVNYNAETGTYQVIAGSLKSTAGNFDEIKNLVSSTQSGKLSPKMQSYATKAKNWFAPKKINIGFEADAYGAAWMEFDSNGNFKGGGGAIFMELDASVSYPLPPAPIVYMTFGLELEASGKLGMRQFDTNAYEVFAELGLDVSPYFGAGVGVKGVADVEAGFQGTLSNNILIKKGLTLSDAFISKASGYIYLKYDLLMFVNNKQKWQLGDDLQLYPRTAQSAQMSPINVNSDAFVLAPRNYINKPSEFLANSARNASNDNGGEAPLFSSDFYNNEPSQLFKTNTPQQSSPQLVQLSHDRELMVWIDDDNDRNAANRTMLMYSVKSGGIWSEPASVYDNSLPGNKTADFEPRLAVTKTGAAVLWQKQNSSLSDDITPDDMMKNSDLYLSEYDGSAWSTPAKVTANNTAYEYGHHIAANNDGGITAVWIENSENDIFGIAGKNNIYRVSNGTTQLIADDAGDIVSLAAGIGYFNEYNFTTSQYEFVPKDTILYAVRNGGDCNVYLYEDDVKTLLDTVPTSTKVGFSKSSYYWFNENYVCLNGGEIIEYLPVNISNLNASLYENNDSRALVWEQPNGVASDLYAIYYSTDLKEWGNPVPLTVYNEKLRGTAGFIMNGGELRLVSGKLPVLEANAADVYGQHDLILLTFAPKFDLELTDVWCDYSEFTANAPATIRATVKNCGTEDIEGFTITVKDDGNTVLTKPIDETIVSGTKYDTELSFALPSPSYKKYTVTVIPLINGQGDGDTKTFEIGIADIAVISAELNGSAVTAQIANIGYVSANNVVCVLSTASGEILETKPIGDMSAESYQSVDLDATSFGTENLLITLSTDSDEMLYSNNIFALGTGTYDTKDGLYIALGKYKTSEGVLTLTLTIANGSPSEKRGTAIIALYRKGELFGMKTYDEPVDGNSTVVYTLTENYGADEVKFFLWNNLDDMLPLDNAQKLSIIYPTDPWTS